MILKQLSLFSHELMIYLIPWYILLCIYVCSLLKVMKKCVILMYHPLPVRRGTLTATHPDTGTTYNYYIGVCSNPNKELLPDDKCMVIQTEYFKGNSSTGHTKCLGRIDNAQLTDTLSKCICALLTFY